MSEKLRVVMNLKNIPEGSTVRHLAGKVEYTVKHSIKIYQEAGDYTEVAIPAKDCVFLVSASGSINAYGSKKEVIWYTDLEELNALMERD